MRAHIIFILDYYDGPILLQLDIRGKSAIGIRLPDEYGSEAYLVVPVALGRMATFREGGLDLLALITDRECMTEWFIGHLMPEEAQWLSLEKGTGPLDQFKDLPYRSYVEDFTTSYVQAPFWTEGDGALVWARLDDVPLEKPSEDHRVQNEATLLQTYDLYQQGQSQAAMEHLFTRTHLLLQKSQYTACNNLLQNWDTDKCSVIITIGLLRACFAAKNLLPSWKPLLDETTLVLGNSPKSKLLQGLT